MPPAPLSAPLHEPEFPLLPGVVGPQIDSTRGSIAEPGQTDAASTVPADASPRQSAPLVPPPAEKWDGAVESGAFLTAQAKPPAVHGAHDLRPVGIALGLFGVVGVAAVVATLLNANRRSATQVPISILRHSPADARRQGGAH